MPVRPVWNAALADIRDGGRFVRGVARLGDPARETAMQAAKAGLAAVAAWVAAVHVFALPLPYLAPWVAMIMVRTTVYWSILSGVRQVSSVLLGIALAFGAAAATPGKELALALVVPAAVLVSRWPRLDDQGIYVPFTALFLITVDSIGSAVVLLRLVETGLGVLIGTAVNLLIFPPVRVRAVRDEARRAADAARRLLRDIAAGLRDDWGEADVQDWVDRARRLDGRVSEARGEVRRGRESLWLNPRSRTGEYRDSVDRYRSGADLVSRVAVSVQAIAGALSDVSRRDLPYSGLDGAFSGHYAGVLDAAADALEARLAERFAGDTADPDRIRAPFAVLEAMEHDVDLQRADGTVTAELQGALLVAVRQLLHDLAE